MKKDVMVSIYTQVYNSKPYLTRCIESILHQTFSDFEYFLIDNGSNDGSTELMEEFAQRDSRIHLIRYEENIRAPRWIKAAMENGSGKYVVNLDSDDWLEATFLEQLTAVAERDVLDIVCTGTTFRAEGKEDVSAGVRRLKQPLRVEQAQMATQYPYYHMFFRPTWAKLVRRELFQKTDYSAVDAMTRHHIFNGADTVVCFAWLRTAMRIGIDDTILHNYLVRSGSVYHDYSPTRFQSVVILYEDAVDFLSRFGAVSPENQLFLAIIYANGVFDTLSVLKGSRLPSEEKLREAIAIAVHPITQTTFQHTDTDISRCKNALLTQLLTSGSSEGNEELSRAVQALLPKCGEAVTVDLFPLFRREPTLMDALFRDDRDALAEHLMGLIMTKKYDRQFNLLAILRRILPERSPLNLVTDVEFFRRHADVCKILLSGNNSDALDQMTGQLLDGAELYQKETFLQIYLSLAALEEQEPAFLFGKIRLAEFCLQEKNYEKCRLLLEELDQMGVSGHEELTALREELERQGFSVSLPSDREVALPAAGLAQVLRALEDQQRQINNLTEQVSQLQSRQQQMLVSIQNAIQELADGNRKINSDLYQIGGQLQKDIRDVEYWANEYERNIVRANWGDVSAQPDFAKKFVRLTRGLDAKSVQAVIRILSRQKEYLHSDKTSLNLFTRAEQEELRLLRENFDREILKLSDNLFAYRNYLLPINHFESSVFYFRHGLDEVENLNAVKGKAVVDVGGFIGDSVLIFAELGPSRIYTFEAVPENFNLLKRTVELNRVSNVVPEKIALGAKKGKLVMHVCGAGSTSIERPGNPYARDIEVPVTTLDAYAAEHHMEIGLIKVDIEGGEPGFLAGAKKTICAQKPILLLSIYHNAHDFFELKPLLESWNLGYRFRIHKPTYGNATSETLLIAEIPEH